ncbi:MAG: dienelactone hydrolase family protein [Betaproteobacteria bacterium]|nr:dienelactone hydrolase family protein [Betaproteobacteria bacterium]
MISITSQDVRIPLGAGIEVPAYRATPAAAPILASVLVLSEIWSVNPNIRSICDRLAHNGIAALAPDLYRGGKAPQESDPAEVVTRSFLDYDDAQGIRDARAFMRWLRTNSPAGARIFVWGFCMGGRFAHYLGACGEPLAGVVNFYGRLVFDRQPNKPFIPMDLAGLVEVPYLGLFGEFDPIVPERDVEELRSRFAARRHPHLLKVFKGAEHAFFNQTRASYHAAAAAEAWDITLQFFRSGSLD